MGGTKFDDKKPQVALLERMFVEEVARVMMFGAEKYGRDNWKKGIKLTRVLSACLRHVWAFIEGEDNDQESGLNHLAHAACNLMFAMWLARYKGEWDDRKE